MTKTTTKCLKNPTYAIFFKSWWLTHSTYDDRYLTLVILFMPVTLVNQFQSYNQFYRAECITVSGFFYCNIFIRCYYHFYINRIYNSYIYLSIRKSTRLFSQGQVTRHRRHSRPQTHNLLHLGHSPLSPSHPSHPLHFTPAHLLQPAS